LSIVVPTRNEAPNIAVLVRRLKGALEGFGDGWELIFVDDSDDGTPQVVRALAQEGDVQIRLLHRERDARSGGLGGAVRGGFAIAQGQVIAVMDADLQHPPEVLPALVAPALSGEAELVAASRYCKGGGTGGLDGPWRRFVSWSCRWMARRLVPASKPLEDPLSGLFALRRSVIEEARLRPDGYKILLEVAARGNWRTATNVPYAFAERYAGNSNAGLREGLIFFRHLTRLALSSRGRHVLGTVSPAAPTPASQSPRVAVKLP
jgi:dolichol-phosphate mannosyltransferase